MSTEPSSNSEDKPACGCEHERPEAELMQRMAKTLDTDHLLAGIERKLASDRCHACTDLDACKVWLDITSIRGAVRAPKFCRNADLFDDLANDAAASSF
jgi:hypothetical protein